MIRIVGAVLAAIVGGVAIWATFEDPSWTNFLAVIDEPWGLVITLDLVAGLIIAAFVVVAVEPNRLHGVLIAVAILVLGNVVTGLWLVWRGRELMSRLASRNPG